VVIQLSRLPDGSRKVMAISEVVGMEGDVITMQDLFVYQREGVGPDGKVLGRFRPTGVRPGFADKLAVRGIDLRQLLFFDEEQRPRDEEKATW
jgi:pilus assembly protein CpaF